MLIGRVHGPIQQYMMGSLYERPMDSFRTDMPIIILHLKPLKSHKKIFLPFLFKSDKLDDSMNLLVGKVACKFSYGTEIIWNVTYSLEFRDKLYDM